MNVFVKVKMRLSHDEVMRKEGEGIVRIATDDGFEYRYLRNSKVVSAKDQKRIDALGIPPAWKEVWVSDDSLASIQAIGLDAKGRKQYLYHHIHVAEAEQQKFLRLKDFIRAMPKLERALNRDNAAHAYTRERVIATMLTMVRLLHIRVGKEQYAKQNKSYGISSLKKQHLTIDGDTIKLRFMGKSKQRLSYSFIDKEIKAELKALLKLEGDKLFQYIDADDNIRRVTDTDLNEYIQQYMGDNFSVKDFRTYGANYHFVQELLRQTLIRSPMSAKRIKRNITEAIERTAKYLRHTKSISKKSYVMEFAVELYKNDPEFFIANKETDVNKVLLNLLEMYQCQVLQI
jgi:DNA topoisomerase-1